MILTLNMDDLCWLIAGGELVTDKGQLIKLEEAVADRSVVNNAACYADNELGGRRGKPKRLNAKIPT